MRDSKTAIVIIFQLKFYLFSRTQTHDFACFAWQWPILSYLYAILYFDWSKTKKGATLFRSMDALTNGLLIFKISPSKILNANVC